jgi:hypothetical protein
MLFVDVVFLLSELSDTEESYEDSYSGNDSSGSGGGGMAWEDATSSLIIRRSRPGNIIGVTSMYYYPNGTLTGNWNTSASFWDKTRFTTNAAMEFDDAGMLWGVLRYAGQRQSLLVTYPRETPTTTSIQVKRCWNPMTMDGLALVRNPPSMGTPYRTGYNGYYYLLANNTDLWVADPNRMVMRKLPFTVPASVKKITGSGRAAKVYGLTNTHLVEVTFDGSDVSSTNLGAFEGMPSSLFFDSINNRVFVSTLNYSNPDSPSTLYYLTYMYNGTMTRIEHPLFSAANSRAIWYERVTDSVHLTRPADDFALFLNDTMTGYTVTGASFEAEQPDETDWDSMAEVGALPAFTAGPANTVSTLVHAGAARFNREPQFVASVLADGLLRNVVDIVCDGPASVASIAWFELRDSDCSGRGVVRNNECSCDAGFDGFYCEIQLPPPTAAPTASASSVAASAFCLMAFIALCLLA